MKILVNAIQLRVAGGRTVATNFLRACRDRSRDHEIVAYVPSGCGFEELDGGPLRVHPVEGRLNWPLLRPWVDYVWWRRQIRKEDPAVLFNMGSIAVPIRTPQLVLFHWPYAIYLEREVWRRLDLRSAASRGIRLLLFRLNLSYASCIAAQTETAATRLRRDYGAENVRVVPNTVSLPSEAPVDTAGFNLPTGRCILLCLSRYYPHKNIEILLPLARRIRAEGRPITIVTTIAEGDHPAAGRLIDAMAREDLGDTLVNLGTVPMERIPSLYAASDGLLLPTLLESFSGTYVEAMFYGKPIFTSDRDFAREVCGDVACYFDPLSEEDILRTLVDGFADDTAREGRVARGRARCRTYPDWTEVAEMYIRLLEEVAASAATPRRR